MSYGGSQSPLSLGLTRDPPLVLGEGLGDDGDEIGAALVACASEGEAMGGA